MKKIYNLIVSLFLFIFITDCFAVEMCYEIPHTGVSRNCPGGTDAECESGKTDGVDKIKCNKQKHCEAQTCKDDYLLWRSKPNGSTNYVNYGVCHKESWVAAQCLKSDVCIPGCHCEVNKVDNPNDERVNDGRAYEDCKTVCNPVEPNCKLEVTTTIVCAPGTKYQGEPVVSKLLEMSWSQLVDKGWVSQITDDTTEESLCNELKNKTKEIFDSVNGDIVSKIQEICNAENVGGGNSVRRGVVEGGGTSSVVSSLEMFFGNEDKSVWKNAEGKFNGARLASDLTAGVVLGTVGGVVSGVVIKKKQLENGFEDLHCTVGGQTVADWGDEFRVGLKK